ncbi:SPFH domain / Band 7 family protein [Anatilimnocola aggregata]|uniref:SPFH domain / Band 7 family protein n=1 Tax=Anatilimnocola aggregata TaxID=2528021 RepID=A0A517YCS3_9BACT|nr:SPFH domain-containing protein [Anatilimnocola aggregata]QDU28031.1 SPFH domain / Band 7 family protein [Anatilimnocola aggregata]
MFFFLVLLGVVAIGFKLLLLTWLALRFIPNNCVGVVEKLWSASGSVPEGGIMALEGEAGYHADLLRGGIHFGLWRWQYRVHVCPLVIVPQGKIGYVYARDGQPLPPSQTLGRVVDCNYFQDARSFLKPATIQRENGKEPEPRQVGQRGRQLAILREGVYAINPALFIVITEDAVYTLHRLISTWEMQNVSTWQRALVNVDGFKPVVIGQPMQANDPLHPEQHHVVDSIGIVTVHDGASLASGEIIAPEVGSEVGDAAYHNNFQDAQRFLNGGGRRGRQYQPLTDGTYFINRWFASVEQIPKTVVPIGYVGVVVSYYGRAGSDLSGEAFRHGERVTEGERGVWERPYGPGKYAFNTYAGNIVLVPTTNFVLHWVTGRSETHRYDDSLRSIDLVTRDAYEPRLPLSVVVHIDYQRAPNVIQRFGDVKKLITQTLDPLLSAYFRDIAHKKTMLELLHDRDAIQAEARAELRRRFHEFDIECVDVLIGKPDTEEQGGKIESLLEQLRTRQLSIEQLETYQRQREASDKRRELAEAQAQADMQTSLTNARVKAQIAESEGEADLQRARKQADKQIVMAEAQLTQSRLTAEQTLVLAEADSQQAIMQGRGEAQRIMQMGISEAAVLTQKVASYGDPRLFVLAHVGAALSKSTQPLVPERVFLSGVPGNGDAHSENGVAAGNCQPAMTGLVGMILQSLLAERSSFADREGPDLAAIKELATQLTRETLQSMNNSLPGNGLAAESNAIIAK